MDKREASEVIATDVVDHAKRRGVDVSRRLCRQRMTAISTLLEGDLLDAHAAGPSLGSVHRLAVRQAMSRGVPVKGALGSVPGVPAMMAMISRR